MKIISWNCNLKFAKKFEAIESFNPDICFIQECEDLPIDFFPDYQYLWTGRNDKKGLGILTKDKTTIVIAHRLSTILNSNNIYVIDKGKVVDSGKHDQLLTNSYLYKNFYEKQIQK